jgi:hypothetical protein
MSTRKRHGSSRTAPPRRDVVTLADLAPRHDVRGGSSRVVFGAEAPPTAEERRPGRLVKKSKDRLR